MKTPMPPVLDPACGSKMFWFNKQDPRAIFLDKRKENHAIKDSSTKSGFRSVVVSPDYQGDFTNLPFDDEKFYLVAFDPPHLISGGNSSWMVKKYGRLDGGWKDTLRKGFSECWRVLKAGGTLVFKWNETQIPVSKILPLTPSPPLFGQRCGKRAGTHWIVFLKPIL